MAGPAAGRAGPQLQELRALGAGKDRLARRGRQSHRPRQGEPGGPRNPLGRDSRARMAGRIGPGRQEGQDPGLPPADPARRERPRGSSRIRRPLLGAAGPGPGPADSNDSRPADHPGPRALRARCRDRDGPKVDLYRRHPAEPGLLRGNAQEAPVRRLAAAVLPLVLATCRGEGPPVQPLRVDDRDRLIALMAGIHSHLLEVQRGAEDPLEPEYIQKHLSGILEKFRHTCDLDLPYAAFRSRANDAISSVEEPTRTPWTPADREERYATLRSLCGGCHRAFVPADPPASSRPDSRQTCRRCHESIYEEWKDTLHARAWIDPEFRMSAGNPPRLECRGCHAME